MLFVTSTMIILTVHQLICLASQVVIITMSLYLGDLDHYFSFLVAHKAPSSIMSVSLQRVSSFLGSILASLVYSLWLRSSRCTLFYFHLSISGSLGIPVRNNYFPNTRNLRFKNLLFSFKYHIVKSIRIGVIGTSCSYLTTEVEANSNLRLKWYIDSIMNA